MGAVSARGIRRLAAVLTIPAVMLALGGCASSPASSATGSAVGSAIEASACPAAPRDELVPAEDVLLGVNLDWSKLTLDEYAARMQRNPAVVVSFTGLPMSADERDNIGAAVTQLEPTGATMMLTLEPSEGLEAVTQPVVDDLVTMLRGINDRGVPVIVRFAHEMNGSWYAWGQQPAAYVETFRRIAGAVHEGTPSSAMMWAPNYGGGYPFSGGTSEALPGTPDHALLDTDGSGVLTGLDDPYAPYYPGDEAVDWVGMSLYHWGSTYPWGENELPEDGKFMQQLTGTYVGAGGDDRSLPDFYTEYAVTHGKPVAIPETAAFVHPFGDDAGERAIKQAWWRQVFADEVHEVFPQLHLISWFEWDKTEVEIGGRVDWEVTGSAETRKAFIADIPDWLVGAPPRSTDC